MNNSDFFDLVKHNMKDYFISKGYSKCKTYKGKRNAICFEKDVDFYTIYIEFHWQTFTDTPDTYDFSINFITTFLLFDETKPRWQLWSFKNEEELLNLFKLIPQKIEEQDFFKKVEENAFAYFHRDKKI